tara:strand:+ start:10 stop:471 length:462 start_codon:yes stop_codon:yes gene_type:complete
MINNITLIPNELIYFIFQNLNNYKISTMQKMLIFGITQKQKLYYIASSRIKLFILLKNKYSILKNKILKHLHYLFNKNMPIRFSYPFKLSNKLKEIVKHSCIYYSPVIPNSPCRFCIKRSNEHIFSEKLLMNYYFPYILSNICKKTPQTIMLR